MKYQNPIIRGFNPDPSICRVGEDYYLVTSTFEYFPGIPVYHSKDLVNWEQIGNCIEREEQLTFAGVKHSAGIWAPTIRYEDGVFYVTATFSGRGNFYVTSRNPATGWSDPVWVDFTGIDPSIFFEDGEMYYCANDIGERMKAHGSEGFSLAKMDKVTGEVIGEVNRIWTGTGGGWVESPHIYRVGGYYYLLASEGGTNQGHMVTVARSRDIWGPYESCPENPIMTNRNDTSKKVSCSGHCDLVEDTCGNWWIVHLGTRSRQGLTNLGRETFLMPVTWVNDWPVIGWDKKSHLEVDLPDRDLGVPGAAEKLVGESVKQELSGEWICTFEDKEWEPQWLFLRNPNRENYVREEHKLILKASDVKLSDADGLPTCVLIRPLDLSCSAEVGMEFAPECDGDCAGLVAYLTKDCYYRIMKCRDRGKNYLVVERHVEDMCVEAYREEIPDGELVLKISNDGEYYTFLYGMQGEALREIARGLTKFLSTELVKSFTGTLLGVFAEMSTHTEEDDNSQAYRRENAPEAVVRYFKTLRN